MVSRILKFTVYMAVVVFEVESLSKVMTYMNHMSLTVCFDEAGWAPWEKMLLMIGSKL